MSKWTKFATRGEYEPGRSSSSDKTSGPPSGLSQSHATTATSAVNRELCEILREFKRATATIEKLPSLLQAIPDRGGRERNRSSWATRIMAAATVGAVLVALIAVSPTLAKLYREVWPVVREGVHRVLIAWSKIDSAPPKHDTPREPAPDARDPIAMVPKQPPVPRAEEPHVTPRQAPPQRKESQGGSRATNRQAAPPERKETMALERLEFVEVRGAEALERLLASRPASRKLFTCLWKNQFVYGFSGEPQIFFVPVRGTLSAREFSTLANDCTHLAFREVHLPAEWQRQQLDGHLDHWGAGCRISPEYIEAWSTVRVEESGEATNRCVPGGTCLIVTTITRCDARTFRDFNLAPRIASSSR